MRPFSVLENEGFVNMIQVLEPKYDMPCRSHFSEKVIPKLDEKTREIVTKKMHQAEFIALTTGHPEQHRVIIQSLYIFLRIGI